MCQDTGLAVNLIAVETPIAVAEVDLPESCVDVQDVIYRHRTLMPNTSFDIARDDARMDSSYGSPEEWFQSNLEAGTLRLVPSPTAAGLSTGVGGAAGFYGTLSAVSGTELAVTPSAPFYGIISETADGDTYLEVDGIGLGTIAGFATSRMNALLVTTVRPTSDAYTLDSIIEHIPPSFAMYLKWFVLRNIWSTDGESKDIARAKYAAARTEELRKLIDAVNREDIGEA
jgi:hypothetical protein